MKTAKEWADKFDPRRINLNRASISLSELEQIQHDASNEPKSQLEAAQQRIEKLEKDFAEAKDILGEIAAYGNCDCDIPNGHTCIVCKASIFLKTQLTTEALENEKT